MRKALVFVLVAVSSVPALAQPDPEGGLVILGWSKKGHIATRRYTENFGIETSCAFDAVIVDLITDKGLAGSLRLARGQLGRGQLTHLSRWEGGLEGGTRERRGGAHEVRGHAERVARGEEVSRGR